jgi:hypothetical protein
MPEAPEAADNGIFFPDTVLALSSRNSTIME